MARKSGATTPFPGMDDAAAALMRAAPGMLSAARCGFHAQDRILGETEDYARHWFERRHAAWRSGAELAARMADGGLADPAAGLAAVVQWQRESLDRIAHDLSEGAGVTMRCASHLARGGAEIGEEAVTGALRAAIAPKKADG